MRTLRATLLILLCLAGSMLRAAEAPWMRGTYLAEGLQGMEVPIAELFREFSRSQAVPVLIRVKEDEDRCIEPRNIFQAAGE